MKLTGRILGTIVALVFSGLASAADRPVIETKFDFFSVPTDRAAEAMLQCSDARKLMAKVSDFAKAGKLAKHDSMTVVGLSGARASAKGIANIEAEMTARDDQPIVGLVFQVVIGEQELIVNFTMVVGRCMLVGVMADPARPASHSLLIFANVKITQKP